MGKHDALPLLTESAKRPRSLKSRGLRAKRILVADTGVDGFWSEVDRQCRVIADAASSTDDLSFAHAVQHWPPADPD